MKRFLHNNSLSIVFFLLFAIAICGQSYTGFLVHNKERIQEGLISLDMSQYLRSGHFIQSTFENWESEFLQMALFVLLTVSLRQKGSSESKQVDGRERVDRKPSARRKGAPWPVKKGGFVLAIYKHSLSIALLILFLLSFFLHLYGTQKDANEELIAQGESTHSLGYFVTSSRFWFESFQNWQSEFLSVFAIVVLSVFLRQQGSPQSKPVDAPDSETGE
jgi:hypothetical protein